MKNTGGQEQKAFLNLAGEFAVASELNRRQYIASVTYGASKSADIYVLPKGVRVEVKATDKKKWPIGARAIDPTGKRSGVIWVFVQFPSPLSGAPRSDSERGQHAPRFFVLTAAELYEAWRKEVAPYLAAYRRKHNREFDESRGVPNISLAAVERFEGMWEKVIAAIGTAVS